MNIQARKSHTQNGGKLQGAFAQPCLTPPGHGTTWLGSCPTPVFSPGTEEKEWILFYGMSWNFLGDWFQFCLPQSSDRNEGIVWISDWRPLKAVAGTVACDSNRRTADSQVAWVQRVWGKEYNRTTKVPRRTRVRHILKLRYLITVVYIGELGKKHTHRPRENKCLGDLRKP